MNKISATIGGLLIGYSSLSIAAVTESCEEYFKTIDTYMDSIQKNEQMNSQFDMVKNQYSHAKEQISQLPESAQEQACKQGQQAIETAMKAAGL